MIPPLVRGATLPGEHLAIANMGDYEFPMIPPLVRGATRHEACEVEREMSIYVRSYAVDVTKL